MSFKEDQKLKKAEQEMKKEWLRRDKNLADREEAYYKIYKFTKDQEDIGYNKVMQSTKQYN